MAAYHRYPGALGFLPVAPGLLPARAEPRMTASSISAIPSCPIGRESATRAGAAT